VNLSKLATVTRCGEPDAVQNYDEDRIDDAALCTRFVLVNFCVCFFRADFLHEG
jgi:hypothetical protein